MGTGCSKGIQEWKSSFLGLLELIQLGRSRHRSKLELELKFSRVGQENRARGRSPLGEEPLPKVWEVFWKRHGDRGTIQED